jgi:hypothetical protein
VVPIREPPQIGLGPGIKRLNPLAHAPDIGDVPAPLELFACT